MARETAVLAPTSLFTSDPAKPTEPHDNATPSQKETTMHYKTIILELLQQRPQMHEQLRQDRMLLPALELYARELRTSQLAWQERLLDLRPGSDRSQIASEALEMALMELENHLPSESPQSEQDELSLDEAMAFILNHTSRV